MGASAGSYVAAALVVAGVFSGSALWWLLLSAGVSRLRARFDARARLFVNRVSAFLLAAFALWQWAGVAAAG